MTHQQQQSLDDFLASIERRRRICIALVISAIGFALGLFLASCQSEPDAIDRMFEAAAEKQVMRMSQVPLGQTKTWHEWRAQP